MSDEIIGLLRPNIRKLVPYRCARDDYQEGILLDANENTHGVAVHDLDDDEHRLELNRYPDPHQIDVKTLLCDFRNSESNHAGAKITPANIYLGVGSDEVIDSLIRATCAPGREKIMTCPPTYGMYAVSADINDVEIVKVGLDHSTFDIRLEAILQALEEDKSVKLLYVCSPGNPTAKQISPAKVQRLLDSWKGGIVVVDEAYIDFCGDSMCTLVNRYPRLVVMQTLSKSFGLAGLRLGACFASEPVARLLNAMKAPYNISSTTSALAQRALQPKSLQLMNDYVSAIKSERSRLLKEIESIPDLTNIGGSDANFLLVRVKGGNDRALKIYKELAQNRHIVVRFRGNEPGCEGCLRISIGTSSENAQLLAELKTVLNTI